MNCYIEQNPNVAFDFDHWEESDDDGHFSEGKWGALPPWRKPGSQGGGRKHPADCRKAAFVEMGC